MQIFIYFLEGKKGAKNLDKKETARNERTQA